jgi:hypothetical protein
LFAGILFDYILDKERRRMRIKEFFEQARSCYNVNDIVTDQSKIIFILESPHKEELKAGVPLAGLSGRSMAKELFLEREIEPMGVLLNKLAKENKDSVYGIINVCPFPLQKSAYPDESFVQEFNAEIEVGEAIRKSTALLFKDEDKNELHQMIVTFFERRISAIATESTIIIPCGRFAEKYVNILSNKDHLNIINGVPHPSYNSWSRERYKDIIQEVRDTGKQKTS